MSLLEVRPPKSDPRGVHIPSLSSGSRRSCQTRGQSPGEAGGQPPDGPQEQGTEPGHQGAPAAGQAQVPRGHFFGRSIPTNGSRLTAQ